MKTTFIFLFFFCTALHSAAQIAVDTKGTKILLDSSKWKISGNNIYAKNSGNTGIGISAPAYKLDVAAVSNPLRLLGVQTGNVATDSVLTILNGVVKKLNVSSYIRNDSTTANNGLTLTGKNVQLGGALIQPTVITASAVNTISIAGLQSGVATDSIVVADPATGILKRISTAVLNKNDSTTANNGLILTGKNVQLGGNLTQSTTVTSNGNPFTFATGGTALNITGLTSGAVTDSLVTINTATGKLNRINPALLNKNDSTTANNGLTLNGKNVQLGGSLTQPTTITASATNSFSIAGLQSGAATDSIVVADPVTGVLKRISTAVLNKNDSTTASNGLTLNGKNIQLGGTLSTASSIITSAANTLAIPGLQTGTSTDSLLVLGTGSTLKKIAQVSFPQLLVDARRITSAYAPVAAYDTIVYNSASINVGAAYNTALGVFTAPASGMYEIIINNSYTLTSTSSNAVMQVVNQVYVNGAADMEKSNMIFRSSTGSANTTISGNTIVNMTSGQTAYIRAGGITSGTAAAQFGSGQHVLKIIRLQ